MHLAVVTMQLASLTKMILSLLHSLHLQNKIKLHMYACVCCVRVCVVCVFVCLLCTCVCVCVVHVCVLCTCVCMYVCVCLSVCCVLVCVCTQIDEHIPGTTDSQCAFAGGSGRSSTAVVILLTASNSAEYATASG